MQDVLTCSCSNLRSASLVECACGMGRPETRQQMDEMDGTTTKTMPPARRPDDDVDDFVDQLSAVYM